MNIMNFLPAGQMKWAAATSGGEWQGPCPWCGGRDRFRVWPDHPKGTGGRYMCRQCGQQGDGVQFLRDHAGLSYSDSCRALQVPAKSSSTKQSLVATPPAWVPKPAHLPNDIWRKQAEATAVKCAENIARDHEGMSYAAKRGLTPETVLRLGIGWNPSDRWESREAWGLPAEQNSNGNEKKVMIPAGLVIPSRRKVGVTAIKVRRTGWHPQDRMPKYMALPGSVPGLALGSGKGKPVVVVESEIDAALVWQEAGDLVDVLALGTAGGKPDADATRLFQTAPQVLVALDYDPAGNDASRWWLKNFPRSIFWPVVRGKDVGDMIEEPGLVRAWFKARTMDNSS